MLLTPSPDPITSAAPSAAAATAAAPDGVRDRILTCAIEWFASHRPLAWSEAQQVENPQVNMQTAADHALAVAVAAHLQAHPSPDADVVPPMRRRR